MKVVVGPNKSLVDPSQAVKDIRLSKKLLKLRLVFVDQVLSLVLIPSTYPVIVVALTHIIWGFFI